MIERPFTNAKEAGNPIIFVNDSFLTLTGFSRDEVLGQGFNFLMARGADAVALAHIEAAFAGLADGGTEISYRCRNGRVFCSAVLISPVRDEAGDIVQYFASFTDLTAHKREQARSEMLIDELNHRVKNTLATVQSIVSQALRKKEGAATTQEAIESRILALSRSHDLLTRGNWRGAGLFDLVDGSLAPFRISADHAGRFAVAGENIRMAPYSALALGIAFHELATNAVKYGALSNEAGTVQLAWSIAPRPGNDRLLLRWEERDGPPVVVPSRKGFGSRVLERGLAHELDGEVRLDFPPDGVICTMDFPAPNGFGDE